MSWTDDWIAKHNACTVAKIIATQEEERSNPNRQYCSACHRRFTKSRPRHYRYVFLNGVYQGKYAQTWCRWCHFKMDKGTAPIQANFTVFDKETKQPLSRFKYYYLGYKEAIERSGFDVESTYTNLPPDVEASYKRSYIEESENPYLACLKEVEIE